MRLIGVVAATGMAVAALLGMSSAHAETGAKGYASCIGGGAKPPPPGVSAGDWFPSVHVIDVDITSGVPPAQVIQRLVDMGVAPDDAATQVRCYLATSPH
ncbi:hypothetical protein [Mycobacterium sp. 94-17]|uniref:hypothetical protein n=1 Tax=Mycobacterium sp. 94-17 TaxID=2986147 RepID=UPI002D1E7EEA|nr:hypothetical protein [Mycobacterium sp. 94-17]MEB4212371.1 hypothetical protein [Mycobacterium sp. 94-17]